MRNKILTSFLFLGLFVLGTSPAQAGYGEIFGTALGASAGGAIGSTIGHGNGQVAAIVTGIVLGGYVGNRVGAEVDRSNVQNISYRHYDGTPDFFSDPPPAPLYGTVYTPNYVAPPDQPPLPPAVYVDQHTGNYCRQYIQPVKVANTIQYSYGTLCLQADGSWKPTR